MNIEITPVGYVHSPYKEKFAIPRQPGLVNAATGYVELCGEFADPNAVRGLDQYSHLWLTFQFHQTVQQGWSPLVRPPRLGGNQKIGVFATRSTFRPNGLGMSVVRLTKVEIKAQHVRIHISGMDLLDGTPIIDIKPYIPYVDSITDAKGGFAADSPQALLTPCFSDQVKQQLAELDRVYPQLSTLIEQILQQDPRPAYKQKSVDNKVYGMRLYDLNIRWQVTDDVALVTEIEKNT